MRPLGCPARRRVRYRRVVDHRRPDERAIRIRGPLTLLVSVILIGASALFLVGRGRWSFSETVYMAINAVSTVGYRELDGMAEVRGSYVVTVAIILAGLGTLSYFQSTLTALLVQGVLGERFRMRIMQKRIDELTKHVIVAGVGATGMHVVEELRATKTSFVVIDKHKSTLEKISNELVDGDMLYVVGDATDDSVLMQAGITRAMGVVAALTEDKDNLFVTLSARSLNASARIVSKVIGPDAGPKMIRAGANATVSPNMIGGRRMASELVRPTVVEFVDQMLRDHKDVLRLEEVVIPEGSWFIGKTLREVPIRAETKLLVVALRVDKKFIYNPEPSIELEVGTVLVVLGAAANVARLRELVVQETEPVASSRAASPAKKG
jgi:voltage-gated potassium channel